MIHTKTSGRAKYLYIKRPIYQSIYYIGNCIKVLFKGVYSSKQPSGRKRQLRLAFIARNLPTTYIHGYLVKPSTVPIAKQSFQLLRNDKSRHLKRTSPNNPQLPTSNTLSVAGQKA